MAPSIEIPSAALRRELWNARVEADMRQRYFARMAQRAHVRDRVLRVAIFFASSATGVAAVGNLGVGPGLFAFATAVLAAVSFTLELGAVAMKHTGFAVDWGRIHQETLDLWTESERGGLSHDEVRASLQTIQRRIEPIDQQSITYRVNAKVLTQCFDQAEAYALARRPPTGEFEIRLVRAKQSIGHPPPPRPPKPPPEPIPTLPPPGPNPSRQQRFRRQRVRQRVS